MAYVIERSPNTFEEVSGAFQSGSGDDAVNHPDEWLAFSTAEDRADVGVYEFEPAEVPEGKIAIGFRFVRDGGRIVQLAELGEPQSQVPASVTPRQLRLALLFAGKLAQVEAFVAGDQAPPEAVISWEYATEFLRGDPMLGQFAAMLGLSDDDVDGLFIAAAQIQ
jgi:hypothetical protein